MKLMKRRLTWLTTSMVAVVVLFGATTAPAQSRTPISTIAVTSFDNIQSQAIQVGELVGVPVEPLIQQFLSTPDAAFMKYYDKSLPLGVCVYLVEGEPVFVGMIPFDLKGFEGDPGYPKDAPVQCDEDGVYSLFTPSGSAVGKQIGKWLFVSTNKSGLELADSIDPIKQLSGMAKRYTISVKANVAAIPTPLKDELLAQIESGMQLALNEDVPDNPMSAISAIQASNAQQSLEQLKMLFYETSQILIGLKLSEENVLDLDIATTAKPNTKMADLVSWKPITSRSYGLIPENAAVAFWESAKVSEATLEQQRQQLVHFEEMFDQLIGFAKTELAKDESPHAEASGKMIERLETLLTTILEKSEANISDEADGMLALTLEMGSPTVVAAGSASDPDAVLDIVGEVYHAVSDLLGMVPREEAEEDGLRFLDSITKSFAAAEVQESDGMKYRIVSIDLEEIPGPEEETAEVLEQITKIWGSTKIESGVASTDDGIVYAVWSADALTSLKSLVQGSSAQPPKGQSIGGYVAFAPVMKFINDVSESIPGAELGPSMEQILAILDSSAGKDKVRFSARPIPNGSVSTISVEEGVLRTIGVLVMMQQESAGVMSMDDADAPQMTDEEIENLIEELELTGAEADDFREQMKAQAQ